MSATGTLSWLTYRGVRAALESEFERRLAHMAAAQQIRAGDVGDIEARGEESDGYLDVQAQLNTLRFATGVADVSLMRGSTVGPLIARFQF